MVSTPLVYLIFSLVAPGYEAVSLLQVQPNRSDLFGPSMHDSNDTSVSQPYLATQVQLITTDRVLDAAIARPPSTTGITISKLPMIAKSEDPKTDLRKDMTVEILKNTFLIRVALTSPNPEEAAAIVNAVVDAYLEQHNDYHKSANKALKKSLDEELGTLAVKISDKKKELKDLFEKGRVEINPVRPEIKPSKGEKEEQGIESALPTVTADQYTQATNTLLQTEMELLETQADLEAATGQYNRTLAARQEQESQPPNERQLEGRIEEEFLNDPDAASLVNQMNEAEEQLQDIASKVRLANDPAKQSIERHKRILTQKWEKLWNERHDKIKQILLAADADTSQEPEAWQAKITDFQVRLEKLKKKKTTLTERIKNLEVDRRVVSSDTFNASMASQELASLLKMQDIISQKLEELSFESKQDVYRVSLHDLAQVPMKAANNKRLKYMAVAPVVIMFLVLGLFLMMEIRAERIADPDALSTRVQSEVYALPPLPTARSIRKRSASEADDQIEQFIQRLDHVRFAVCGNPSDLAKGRCVLITSAIGREGKTTLAAQLAARCGNAGMSTLLIDADLRRTGLCSLLDVPEGPGLSDLLTSDELTPTDLIIPVQGGTFHLLPAGTPIPDPSRGLQNRKLGLLITQFRQIYDLVIIDSPPVLPVPDALILGRWADGAVLAVRYDSSRFPQVERARRQLDGAGICILGTVINGMRNSDTYYGSYSYSRRPTSQPDPSAAI
ncbi:MAG: polysaccharide biosynthesis tyrosine autokinase [Isosphaeraceae bacterium]